jgi:hypothetical protein
MTIQRKIKCFKSYNFNEIEEEVNNFITPRPWDSIIDVRFIMRADMILGWVTYDERVEHPDLHN